MADTETHSAVVKKSNFLKSEKMKRQKSLLKEHIYDFNANTTLHGLRYVTDRRLSLCEKVFWLLTFLISVGFCIYRIEDLWMKWRDSPMIVTFNEHLVPAGDVPFPSVTICPQMKVNATKFNYSAIHNSYLYGYYEKEHWDIDQLSLFLDILPLCTENAFAGSEWGFQDRKSNETIKLADLSFVENIKKVSPSFNQIFVECYWRSKIVPCANLFKTVLTAEGICFNMNSLQANEIFRENSTQTDYELLESKSNEQMRGWTADGYYDHNEEDPYPRRGHGIGLKPELSIMLLENKVAQDKTCNGMSNGYKVYIQHPQDLPSASMNYYTVIPDNLSPFALKLNIISTPENLRHLSPKTRQCFYSDERYLRYFNIYTESNCKTECLANITYKMCSCVRFSMPHITSNEICTKNSVICMQNAMKYMTEKDDCNCLSSCNSIDYDAEVLRTNFNFKDFLKRVMRVKSENLTEYIMKNFMFSRMDLYYKQPRYISTRRSELFGFTDFLANCGGLLGLFLGFSFLSFVELIYFSTLRFWCTIHRDAKEQNESQNEN